ncbi:radical SAM family heme chaperone HemW [Acidicapsa acidisoli]|uniref:radical SAM family heme chaperone HemW n=1 Tax=Acidicapsa acidisoli TaxID=1615681 RepID=UPI0021E0C542|nr:radical SAM family heme chaperone HemW [Acidicapsa acidisoli]
MPASSHNSLGLYFSIPFCRAKCTYCNFASGVYPASDHARYVDRLLEDLANAPSWAESMQVDLPKQVDTIYFGGGTPVLLAPELFTRIFAAVRDRFQVDADAEITIECAPGQLSDETLASMAEAGVNRVSLGVQSFVDREAALSGRLHTRTQVLDDLRRLRAAGIANLNIDLLAGLAEQTMSSWRESLSVLAETGVPHASVYMLEIDEDSRLGRELISGGARYSAGLVPTDDAIARMYEDAILAFADAGLQQYEISNFAREGQASRHNLRYWQRRPYLGVGLDASSMLRSSVEEDRAVLRATTTDDLSGYLSNSEASSETAWLGSAQQLEEAWFLGLRCNSGVRIDDLRGEFGASAIEPPVDAARRLAADGLLIMEGDIVRLTSRGRLISNDVFAEFLGLASAVEMAR